MPIAAGTRLGPYEVVAPVGAGGMGEVYRATDTRLDRVVAIKVVAPEFAQRFEREAKSISALNHPHICTLYDVGPDYLVMEFVEGESLEERLKKGPLPMEQVLRYGIEIAEALDKAHRAGIVHRDLKPSNIMITKSGAKLLDFGLAKPLSGFGPTDATLQKALTSEGTILGTFQYMAPEQLEGLEADARTDIFALGAVLYEMATGKRAFEGKTKTSLIAAIVDRDPPSISSIQPMTPPAFERVVKTCLAKDPEDRWQNARDVANELRWIQKGVPDIAPRRKTSWFPWTIAAAALIAAVVLGALWQRSATRRNDWLTFSIMPPEKVDIDFDVGPIALSPDGQRLAFIGIDAAGKRTVWIRPLHSLSAQSLAGTDDAVEPFWSPDGRFIAFFAGTKLKRIDVSGGPPQVICDAQTPRGGTWGADGTIVFARESSDGLYRVPASGGAATQLTTLATGEASHRWPFFLPDGKHVIFLVGRGYGYGVSTTVTNTLEIVTVATGARKRLVDTQSSGQYAAGHLLFCREQSLVAQPLDLDHLQLTGEPVAIAEGVAVTSTNSSVFSVNERGQLVYEAGAGLGLSTLQWIDPSGKPLGDVASNADFRFPAVSHDGRAVAVEIATESGNGDIWIIDLARGTRSRLTFGPGTNFYPHWSPDDRYIYFTSNRNDPGDIYRKPATGVGAEEEIVHMPGLTLMTDISRDGRYIAFGNLDPHLNRGFDIWTYSFAEKKSTPFLSTRFNEGSPKFSPDGHWIAYRSDETGRTEAYVQSFPPSGGKWQVSTNGGTGPVWTPDGSEIYYVSPENKLMVVPVKTAGGTFEAGIPRPVIELHSKTTPDTRFSIAPDGKRILLNTLIRDQLRSPMTFVANWTELLAKR